MGTMHGKERQVAPAFAAEFGARVIAPPGIDTDQFGTFAAKSPGRSRRWQRRRRRPGFGRVAVREGLPCRVCGSPTTLVAADILGCPACEHRSEDVRVGTAEPRYCSQCNP